MASEKGHISQDGCNNEVGIADIYEFFINFIKAKFYKVPMCGLWDANKYSDRITHIKIKKMFDNIKQIID